MEAPKGFVIYEPVSKRKGASLAMREAAAKSEWSTFDVEKAQQRNIISALQRWARKENVAIHIATTDTQIAVRGD